LQIRNTAGDGTRSIDVRLVELSQAPNGGWKIAGPEEKGLSSSMAWTSLSEARVDIAPLEPAVVMVRFSPPVTALGTYAVGIIAETPAPQESSGLVVRMRFLIPVIVQIQGRPVRQNIKPDDLVMHYHD